MMSSFKEDELVLIKEEIPLGVFGTVKNVADTVAFLVSEKASYITGQIVGVNGGMVI